MSSGFIVVTDHNDEFEIHAHIDVTQADMDLQESWNTVDVKGGRWIYEGELCEIPAVTSIGSVSEPYLILTITPGSGVGVITASSTIPDIADWKTSRLLGTLNFDTAPTPEADEYPQTPPWLGLDVIINWDQHLRSTQYTFENSTESPKIFDVRVSGGNVQIYIPDYNGTYASFVRRNGREIPLDYTPASGGWEFVASFSNAIMYVWLVVEPFDSTSGDTWPDGEYARWTIETTGSADPANTNNWGGSVMLATINADGTVYQLRNGAANLDYTHFDGDCHKDGGEPPDWFRSLERGTGSTVTGDQIAGLYGIGEHSYWRSDCRSLWIS